MMKFDLVEFDKNVFLFDFVYRYFVEINKNYGIVKVEIDDSPMSLVELYNFCDFLLTFFSGHVLSNTTKDGCYVEIEFELDRGNNDD